jgi:ABC-type uncharacterized transport system permease subunit
VNLRRWPRVHAVSTGAAAFLVGMACLVLFLVVAGYDVPSALAALWRGAFGSPDAIASATLVRATPLVILGLAFALANRGGALNIGMEGQFMLGAAGATVAGVMMHGVPPVVAIPVTLVAGMAGGAAWIAAPVLLRVRFGVTEVISTLLLTFVADALISWCVTGPLQEASGIYPQSDAIALSARLPRIVAGTRLHAGALLALALSVLLTIFFMRSAWAFRLRAVGANPTAARVSGRIHPGRIVATALFASGALAGLGGAMEVSGVTHALYQNLSPGYGFTAIAVALLGRLQPLAIVAAGLLFGALEAGAGAMQRDAGIPAVAVQVVEAIVILVMIIIARPRASR